MLAFPRSARLVPIPSIGRSELEIVRFLLNADAPEIDRLLSFINAWLPTWGATDLVKQRDPFQFRRLLAEIYLFAHLRTHLGAAPRRLTRRPDERGHEMETPWRDQLVKFEVYTPFDFVGLAMLQEHLLAVFRYAEVARGFVLDVSVEALDDSVERVWYAYSLPDETSASQWLRTVEKTAQGWLSCPDLAPGDEFTLDVPGGVTRLRVKARVLVDEPAERLVTLTFPTRSSDARLFFECGTAEQTATSSWGKKLAAKMKERQAGQPHAGVLRILIVNFAELDTGWPEFISWPQIAERITQTVDILARQIGGTIPYDVVLPAWLGLTSCFGSPVGLDPSKHPLTAAFIKASGLDRMGERGGRRIARVPDLLALVLQRGFEMWCNTAHQPCMEGGQHNGPNRNHTQDGLGDPRY